MALRAVGLVGKIVVAVPDPVMLVLWRGSPAQILQAIVVLDVVQVTGLLTWRTRANEGLQHQPVDKHHLALDLDHQVALRGAPWIQELALVPASSSGGIDELAVNTAHSTVVRDFVPVY